MNAISFRLRPRGPWATPWHADSLFGALSWELLRRQGEPALQKMLAGFRKGDPPFVLSDGCPSDWLPRPLVLDGGPWITREQFTDVRAGKPVRLSALPEPWRPLREIHASPSGSPFETEDWTWADDFPRDQRFITVYARVVDEWVEPLRQLLVGLGTFGFGKRRTLGRGAFEVDKKVEACAWLGPQAFENGFVTLSRFVPSETDPVKGRWTVAIKYPKFGESRSAEGRPFKGRLVQLGPGSCFEFPGRPKRWYGRMISGLPGYPKDALHYGLGFAVGISWPKSG